MRVFFLVLSLLLTSQFVSALTQRTVVSTVKKVGTAWNDEGQNAACIYLSTNDVIRVDLTTAKGQAELLIALSAKATNTNLSVIFDDSQALVAGCILGTTIRPHGIITN